jgi:hypothetical protein
LPAPQKARQEPSKARLLTITTVVTLVMFVALVVFVQVLKETGLLSMFRYIVFLACGLVFAQIAFFFKKESQASLQYKNRNLVVKLGGQAAIAALVVLGNYWLVPKDEQIGPPQGIFGYVVHGTNPELPVNSTKITIYGGPETETSNVGGFKIEKILIRNQPQSAGDPITFAVSDWVIFDPYIGERGRMYLPKPSTEPIKLRVLRPGDPAFLSSNSIEKILSHKTFLFEKANKSYKSRAQSWNTFLDARAMEIGFPLDKLNAAVQVWTRQWATREGGTDYQKGLAALYSNDIPKAQQYFNTALKNGKSDIQVNVAAAYAQYQAGNDTESIRLLTPLQQDPTLKKALTVVKDPANQSYLQSPGNQLQERTTDFVRSMAVGDFRSITDTYNDALARDISTRRQMPLPAALGSTWQTLVANLGPFQGIEDVQVDTRKNSLVALAIARFKNGKANIEFAYELPPSQKLCALWLRQGPSRTMPPGQEPCPASASVQPSSTPSVSPVPTQDWTIVACSAEAQMKSPSSDKVIQLRFTNNGALPVHIFWVNYFGKRELYHILKPDTTTTQTTFAGHAWVVAEPDDQCRQIVVMGQGPAEVPIK